MFRNSRLPKYKSEMVKEILHLTVRSIIIVVIGSLLSPALSAADGDTRKLKPQGTGESDITIWFPESSVDIPVLATADYIPEESLPEGISYPPEIVGQAFTFGLWNGEGSTVRQFDPSIVINTRYQNDDRLC